MSSNTKGTDMQTFITKKYKIKLKQLYPVLMLFIQKISFCGLYCYNFILYGEPYEF